MPKKKSKNCLMIMTGAFHTDGGIAAVNRLVIKAIADAGYSLDVNSLTEKDAHVDARYIPAEVSVNYQVFHGNKYTFTLTAWDLLLKKQYDYIFVDHVNLATILLPFLATKRSRYIVWLHGVEVFPPKPDFEGNIGLKYAWMRLSSSEYTKNVVQQNYPSLSIAACDLALDPVQHGALPFPDKPHAEVRLKAIDTTEQVLGRRVILHVGRMVSGERYKGQVSLLRAFPEVLRHYPDAQLILVGRGNDAIRLHTKAKELPVACHSHIFMPGYVPDQQLDQLYQNCYVFAMPSIGEGFGLVYLEAMRRGKACLGGKMDATPCVVRDGLTGFLVDDPRSPEQVAEALIWFLSHPEETRRMGLAGYELVKSYYLFPHFQERFWRALLP